MLGAEDSKYVPALGFRWLTPFYDFVVGATTREGTFKRALIRQAAVESGQRILDLACGTGTLSIWMKQECPQADIIGVDGDPSVLSIAKKKAINACASIQFDQALSFELPYPDAHFDRVVTSLFFHHLVWNDKVRTVREIHRVLRPGGQLHVADWGKAGNSLMRSLFFLIQLLDGFENTKDNVNGRLIDLFEQGRFEDVRQTESFSTIFGTMALYCAVNPKQIN